MFVRLSAAIAAVSLLSGAAFAQGAKPTDPQIAHIAYTAGVIDIAAAKQALAKTSNKDVKAFAGAGFVVVGGADGGGGGGDHHGRVGEGAIQLGGKEEARIDCGNFAAPELGELGLDRAVERRVDFSGVEKAREVFEGMHFAVLHSRGIEDAFPVFVGPSGGAEANVVGESLWQAGWCRGSHEWNRRRRAGQE